MQRRDAWALGAGVVIGVVAIGVLWAATRRPPAAVEAGPVVPTTSSPVWVTPLEARIGPSVVFPTALEVSDGTLALSYDVRDVLTADDAAPGTPGPGAAAAPARWTLIGTDFEITVDVIAPSNRGVRFPVPAGFTPDATTAVRLDAYWLAAAVEFPFSIDRSSAAWYPIGPGLQARLVEAIEQADNAIVIIEVDGSQALTDQMTIDGRGREWVSSSRSMLGSHRWTLDYRGEELPDPLPLVVQGVQWFEVETSARFDLEPLLP
jgi:hypothetical protein